ncbi:MAG: ABC transporter permease [Caldilinea sp.]|jgi:peptide/nickel transport system permease protein|uniref:ABC transporter permease n=1 Tax=Caldilinea sp. TaxID=2293560 RepID=UPI0030A16289
MIRYLINRVLWIPVVLILLSLITFVISRMVPGDPVKLAAGPQARPEQIQRLTEEFGLDRPLPEQYLRYMGGLLQGNWGYSISNRREVLPDLLTYFAATLELTLVATLLGLTLGIPLAIVAARWRDLWPDHLSRFISIGAVSVPVFWIAIILQLVFGQMLNWLPVSGRFDPRQTYPTTITGLLLLDTLLVGNWQGFITALRYILLPAFCQSLLVIALVTRQLRGDLLDMLRKDFVMVARANGIKERIIWTRYLLKNALIATVSMLGFLIGFALGGSVLIEFVFDWPGVGQYATKAALLLDFQVIMGATLFIGVVVVLVNLITDILYRFVDPRIRFS